MAGDLWALLRPQSVALVGASANPAKLGNVALVNLSMGDYTLYPVNPREDVILGLKCYGSVSEIPGPVDMAVISLPADGVIPAVKDCVKKGVSVVIVNASGFKEIGPDGEAREMELTGTVKGTGTRLLGPNTMGVLVPKTGLDTIFIPRERSPRPGPGDVAIVSQSGAVSVAFMEKAASSRVGLSACIGLGNKADIDEIDILQLLADHDETRCIALYLESFSDGRRFLNLARAVSLKKPIVLLKSGRSAAGSAAARSHTGAIASSSDALVDGALRQAGVVRVYDEEELLDVAKALSRIGHISGDRVCVVASAGGYGVVTADLVESTQNGAGLRMATLCEETRAALREVVPQFASVGNPVDLTAAVTDDMYDRVLGILKRDAGIDVIVMSLELQPPGISERLVDVAERHSRSTGPPLVIGAFGGSRADALLQSLEERRMVAYPTLWRAVRAIRALSRRGEFLSRQN
jgi:acyl-CoA synthetase (NDP forming)